MIPGGREAFRNFCFDELLVKGYNNVNFVMQIAAAEK